MNLFYTIQGRRDSAILDISKIEEPFTSTKVRYRPNR